MDVASEITALHADFERWMRGEGERDLTRVEQTLSDTFTFVPPNGSVVSRDQLMAGLRESWGQRQIRISIQSPTIHWSNESAVLATYEEWHEHETYTTARQSTVLLRVDEEAPGGWRWQHVHETWLKAPPQPA